MADSDKKPPSIRDHVQAVQEKLVAEGKIVSDASAAAQSVGLPSFSEGTRPIDQNTGKPVQPGLPTFAEGEAPAVDPSVVPTNIVAPTVNTDADPRLAKLQEHKQAVAATPAVEPESAPAQETQAAGAEAAEAAAQAIADEFDEFEFEDPDLNIKYPVRVPKQYLEPAKRGYGRRAAYDRAMSYAKNAEPVLRQMIEDGRIQAVLPLIQAAIENPQFGEYIGTGYQRLTQGLPLIEQARQEAAQAAAAQAQPQYQAPAFEYDSDPFLAEQMRPLMQQLETQQQRLERLEQERQQFVAQQQEQARRNQQIASEMQAAHRDLAVRMPDLYTGDLRRDQQTWERTLQYAREAGYVDTYGIRAGIVFAGDAIRQMENERLAATGSPAAAMLAQAETQQMAMARQQAAAASRKVGGGAPTQVAPPPPRPKPSTLNANGTKKDPAVFIREMQEYIASQR